MEITGGANGSFMPENDEPSGVQVWVKLRKFNTGAWEYRCLMVQTWVLCQDGHHCIFCRGEYS